MEFAVWAYPWDLLDEGVASAVDRLVEMGITEINLATHYHTVQAFLPHNPERRTFFAKSSSYFQPGDGYSSIEPLTNEKMGEADWVATISEQLEETPLSLNSWTIGCHNTQLGQLYPKLTQTNAHGDNLVYALCPSNPTVRTYLSELLSDLDRRRTFDRIELESFDYFYGTGFGWHHDKYHTQLGGLGEFLYGICFCNHCTSIARNAGIDVEQARYTAQANLDNIAEGRIDGKQDRRAWLRDHPELKAYVDQREHTLTDFYAEITEGVTADLGYYVGLLDVEESWIHGTDLSAMADYLDYYTVIAYEPSRDEAVGNLEAAAAITDDIPLHAGVLPGHPAVYDEQTVCEIVEGIADFGADRISFYNYGLLPKRNLSWIKNAIDSI